MWLICHAWQPDKYKVEPYLKSPMLRSKNALKLVVIDRDGTLNTYREGYIKSPEEFEAIPGSLEAIAMLNCAGWHVVVASNQPGLGRGVMDMAALNAIHTVMHQQLAAAGARIDAVFFCPHSADDGCDCHKPLPGLLLQIAERYSVELSSIHVVGDALRDTQAAAQAGCIPHLVCTGEGECWRGRPLGGNFPPNTQVHADLLAFARFLLAQQESDCNLDALSEMQHYAQAVAMPSGAQG